MSTYVADDHETLGTRLGHYARGSEMITEIYVPRDALVRFLSDVRSDFLAQQTDLIYGTIRLIARDDEIRRVVAELDVHIAEVEASVAALKALLGDEEIPGEEDPAGPELR